MYFTALLFNIILGTILAKSTDIFKKTQAVTEHHGVGSPFAHKTFPASVMERKHKTLPKNMTYIDIPDNSMHVPIPAEDTTPNRKTPKKTPKRTIQKIIKKGRAKRKFYVKKNAVSHSLTSTSTPITIQESEEVSQRIDTPTTQPHSHRKKIKKWNDRTYQIPLHKLSSKKEQKRTKRELKRGRDNTFILEDFDEIEFLSKEKGVDVANVHIKNYW